MSENLRQLERTIIGALPSDRPPTEQEIADLAARLRTVFLVTDDEFGELLKRLHARMAIQMDTGVYLVAEHRPWLNARKPEIDPFYWERFQQLLTKKGWPQGVVGPLGRVGDDILDLLGDPSQDPHWRRRGLVVGGRPKRKDRYVHRALLQSRGRGVSPRHRSYRHLGESPATDPRAAR